MNSVRRHQPQRRALGRACATSSCTLLISDVPATRQMDIASGPTVVVAACAGMDILQPRYKFRCQFCSSLAGGVAGESIKPAIPLAGWLWCLMITAPQMALTIAEVCACRVT
jgi:hypothetical protein